MGRRYTSVDNFVNNYCKKIEKKLDQTLCYISEKVEEDFLKVTKNVMDNYYSDYSPKIYERIGESGDISGSLKDAYRGINKKNAKGYSAGVSFDSQLMSHPGITYTGEYFILENFMSGVHGNENVHVTNPHPWEILNEYYQHYDRRLDKHYKDGMSKFFGDL